MNEKIEALQSAFEYIEKLHPAVVSCAEKLHNGNLTQAYEQIGLISQGLEWLVDVFKLTQDVHDLDATALKSTFAEFIEALENEDTVLIADLLEYEIGEQLEKWHDSLEGIIRK